MIQRMHHNQTVLVQLRTVLDMLRKGPNFDNIYVNTITYGTQLLLVSLKPVHCLTFGSTIGGSRHVE